MEFILDNKWIFLIIAEILFWGCLIVFFIFRYWFGFKRVSIVLVFLFILNDLWIACIAYFDYQRTGVVSIYQVVIIAIIVYALTLGKNDMKKLDFFMKRQVAKWKGEPLTDIKRPAQLYGMAYALKEWQQFFAHVLVFSVVHIIFVFSIGLSDEFTAMPVGDWFGNWFDKDKDMLPFANEAVNKFSKAWLLVFFIDFAITLSYTVFPKKRSSSWI